MLSELELREVFHLLFLEHLLKNADLKLYTLKGGVNLRFFFNSPRYSEDIDLDVKAGSVETLKKNGYKILSDANFKRRLQSFGIQDLLINDPSKAKHTQTTQRFRLRLITASGDELPTKIEFSRREQQSTDIKVIERINPQLAQQYKKLPYRVQHYDGASALKQKIEALAGRTQVQARDLFDIYLLKISGYAEALKLKDIPQDTRDKAIESAASIEYQDYEGQVLDFLEREYREQFSGQDFWIELESSLVELLT